MANKQEDFSFELSFFEDLYQRLPRDTRVVSALAHLYTKTGQVTSGLRMDRKLVRLKPEDPVAHYNLACSLALKERKAEAVRALREAMKHGYRDYEWMRQDPDLANLREHAGFLELLREVGVED